MSYQQTIDDALYTQIGMRGVSDARFKHWKKQVKHAGKELLPDIEAGELALLKLYEDDSPQLDAILKTAEDIRARYKKVVVLGTGGSTLCGQAITHTLHLGEYGEAVVEFWENIDPHTMGHDKALLDAEETLFIAISKSGGTLETLAQTYICVKYLVDALGKDAVKDHLIVISDPNDNNSIRKLAAAYGATVYDHEPDIGGRFAIFTNVGLLPAAIAGVDIKAVLAGARDMLAEFIEKPKASRPGRSAALHLGLQENGIRSAMLMTYIDRYHALTRWYCQVHAESLGKHKSATNPVAAWGTIDQHSQLQLYLDGPNDKYYTLLLADRYGEGVEVPKDILADNSETAKLLRGRTLGDVISASQEGTRESLIQHMRPVRTVRIDSIDAHTTGALAMQIILETLLIARVQGFDPFGQPAVEDGKARTRAKLQELA